MPEGIIEVVAMHHNFEGCAAASKSCQIVFAANWIQNGANESELGQVESEPCQEFKARLDAWNQACLEKVEELENA